MKKDQIKIIKWHVRRCVDIEIKNISGKWTRDQHGDRYVLLTGGPNDRNRITLVYDEATDQWYGANPKYYTFEADIRCWQKRVNLRHTIKFLEPTDMSRLYSEGVAGVVAQKILMQAT